MTFNEQAANGPAICFANRTLFFAWQGTDNNIYVAAVDPVSNNLDWIVNLGPGKFSGLPRVPQNIDEATQPAITWTGNYLVVAWVAPEGNIRLVWGLPTKQSMSNPTEVTGEFSAINVSYYGVGLCPGGNTGENDQVGLAWTGTDASRTVNWMAVDVGKFKPPHPPGHHIRRREPRD